MIEVLAFPAFKNKDSNPYNYLLYSGIEANKAKVREFSFAKSLALDYDIIHVHWPEFYLNSNYFIKALVYSCVFLGCLIFARLFGKKVVWTAHNLKPHSIKYPFMNNVFWRIYKTQIDGVVSLSKANEEKLFSEFDIKKTVKKVVVHHGLYSGYYENNISKGNARKIFSITEERKVCLFIGQVKPYKNVELLIDIFNSKQMQDDFTLIIAGRFECEQYYQEVKSRVISDNIIINNEFISNSELQNYFNVADVCVLPFTDIFNSGSVLLSASFDTPVITPTSKNFIEYGEILGKGRVITYENDLTAERLSQLLMIETNPDKVKAPLLEWPYLQGNLAVFYRSLLA